MQRPQPGRAASTLSERLIVLGSIGRPRRVVNTRPSVLPPQRLTSAKSQTQVDHPQSTQTVGGSHGQEPRELIVVERSRIGRFSAQSPRQARDVGLYGLRCNP